MIESVRTLCDICIAEYIIANKSGKDSVITILDSLGRNKSSCFSRYKDKLAYSYYKIWSQLSPHERRLMKWGIDGGVTLNDRGMALQKGLDYYKDLGDVPQSRFNDFRSLLDDDCPF